jgi:hypothetical protein
MASGVNRAGITAALCPVGDVLPTEIPSRSDSDLPSQNGMSSSVTAAGSFIGSW